MSKYYIYIVLTRTSTTLSKLIHFFTKDEYTHAAISLDKNLNSMYSFGRKNTYNPFIGRFRKENINEGIYGICKTLPGTILEVEVTKQQYEKVEEMLWHFQCNSHIYKYNYKGLISNLINRPVYYDNRFLCSEFVYYILNKSGVLELNIPRNLVRPQNLLCAAGASIYEGDLKEMSSSKTDLILNDFNLRKLGRIYEQA